MWQLEIRSLPLLKSPRLKVFRGGSLELFPPGIFACICSYHINQTSDMIHLHHCIRLWPFPFFLVPFSVHYLRPSRLGLTRIRVSRLSCIS